MRTRPGSRKLEAKRAERHKRSPSTWGRNDLHIGTITFCAEIKPRSSVPEHVGS
jgi:hypothetical protein